MCVSTLFHIRQRRIFHLKNECLYVIIVSTNNFRKLFLQKNCWRIITGGLLADENDNERRCDGEKASAYKTGYTTRIAH